MLSIGVQTRKVAIAALSALCGVVLSCVLAEIGMRILSPIPSGYRAMPPGLQATFNAQDHAHGVLGPSVFKVNSMGFRSREWSPDRASEFRVLCLGGSTTESILNDQNRTWTALLEGHLNLMTDSRVWVGNMGRAGLASQHHIAQLRHLDEFDPDLVIALVGSSDFMSRLKLGDANPNASGPVESDRILEEQAFAVVPDGFRWNDPGTWVRSTRLWRLLSTFVHTISDRSERQDSNGASLERWRAMRAKGKRTGALPSLDSALDAYEHNLKEMVRIARNANVPIILMTQPSIWRSGMTTEEKSQLWMGGVGEFREAPGALFYEPEALERGMDAYNQRLLQVCRETSIECIDLAAAVPKSTVFFYDDEHFTDVGQEVVASHVAEAVVPLLQRPGPYGQQTRSAKE